MRKSTRSGCNYVIFAEQELKEKILQIQRQRHLVIEQDLVDLGLMPYEVYVVRAKGCTGKKISYPLDKNGKRHRETEYITSDIATEYYYIDEQIAEYRTRLLRSELESRDDLSYVLVWYQKIKIWASSNSGFPILEKEMAIKRIANGKLEDIPLEMVEFSHRAFRRLQRNGCKTLGDVVDLAKSGKLYEDRNIRRDSFDEIMSVLQDKFGVDYTDQCITAHVESKRESIIIDSSFDFTTDTPGFWDGFWNNKGGLGGGSADPDLNSPTLQKYHKALWSKVLPDGRELELSAGKGFNYLFGNGFWFGSDLIVTSFRNGRCEELITEVKNNVPNYQEYVENYVHKAYTIGGSIIFPKHNRSMNQMRGVMPSIGDRWDLTLECIRRFYKGEDSPLYSTIKEDQAFFELFVDFKGYVDFFYLQDCVAEDYSNVKIWLGKGDFTESPYPQTVNQYLAWVDKQLEFVAQRNKRIEEAVNR